MNVLIIEARYHAQVADALADGATGALEKGQVKFERVSVPGALEIPTAIALASRSGHFDGFVALGSVIQGGNLHFEIIARESASGLMRLGEQGLCIGNGIIATVNEEEALRMARDGDAGGDAARACLSLMTLKGRLGIAS